MKQARTASAAYRSSATALLCMHELHACSFALLCELWCCESSPGAGISAVDPCSPVFNASAYDSAACEHSHRCIF